MASSAIRRSRHCSARCRRSFFRWPEPLVVLPARCGRLPQSRVELAHELAHVLHLAALAFEVGDALGFNNGLDQLVGQAHGVEQVRAQRQQFLAQVLKGVAFAFEIGAAGIAGVPLSSALSWMSSRCLRQRTGLAQSNLLGLRDMGGAKREVAASAPQWRIIAAAMNKPSPARKAPRPLPRLPPPSRARQWLQLQPPVFEELVDRALAHAKKLGATDAVPRRPKVAVCRSACARASWKTWSATATSRWA